jgi:anti-sigma factor ChrR (cupin superfamily)
VSADQDIDEIRARAALYALGLLPADEAALVEAELAAGEPRWVEEVAACRSVADDLAYAAAPQTPSPGTRQRVLDAVAAVEAPRLERDGVRFVRPQRLGWRPVGIPGVEIKVLHLDREAGRVTLLTRLAPGTVFPTHRHAGCEEIYLIDGDVTVNGVPMRPGDYCSAPAGSAHDGIRSAGGCTYLVSTSTRDAHLD